MQELANTTDKISRGLFFVAFLSSKLKSIPVGLIALIFNFISLALYILGYSVWYLSSWLTGKAPSFYTNGDASDYGYFKNHIHQYKLSSILGIVASVLSIASFWVPGLALAAAAVFLFSNVYWCLGERNKLKQYKINEDERLTSQQHYYDYALLTTAVSFLAVAAITSSLFFPSMAVWIIVASTYLSVVISCYALTKWIDSYETAPDTTQTPNESTYQKLNTMMPKYEPDPNKISQTSKLEINKQLDNKNEQPQDKPKDYLHSPEQAFNNTCLGSQIPL